MAKEASIVDDSSQAKDGDFVHCKNGCGENIYYRYETHALDLVHHEHFCKKAKHGTETSVIMDEATVKLFILFQQYRDTFQILVDSKMLESPFSVWQLSFNGENVLTEVKQKDKIAYRR